MLKTIYLHSHGRRIRPRSALSLLVSVFRESSGGSAAATTSTTTYSAAAVTAATASSSTPTFTASCQISTPICSSTSNDGSTTGPVPVSSHGATDQTSHPKCTAAAVAVVVTVTGYYPTKIPAYNSTDIEASAAFHSPASNRVSDPTEADEGDVSNPVTVVDITSISIAGIATKNTTVEVAGAASAAETIFDDNTTDNRAISAAPPKCFSPATIGPTNFANYAYRNCISIRRAETRRS